MRILNPARMVVIVVALGAGVALAGCAADVERPPAEDFAVAGPVVPTDITAVEFDVSRGTVRSYYGPTNYEETPCPGGIKISTEAGRDGWVVTCGHFSDNDTESDGLAPVQRLETQQAVSASPDPSNPVGGRLEITPANRDEPPKYADTYFGSCSGSVESGHGFLKCDSPIPRGGR